MSNKINRWQMNRIGFVHFWLYDDQDFRFADGKLLLRGANGSGKSITTQSFIPFILDGNSRPERLDPFGSRDRKMEYYLIGAQEEDESTGYLYLEFKKEGSELYRTIGIGLRAQKGKGLSFWGFCLKDGRRIGYDFFLYREVGSTKIPLAKNELKKEIEDDCFVENGQSYMEMVNRNLFGFQRLEQYDQFIRLLIKVRAPKLSKEFTPSKVYDVLNSSLQTLSNEDLRAMVDAMEKMDEIHSRLESYKEGYKDAGIIKVEYDRYNQYMLGKKAGVYQENKEKAQLFTKNLVGLEQEIKDLDVKVQEDSQALIQYRHEREGLANEKAALEDSNLVRAAANQKRLRDEIGTDREEQEREETQLAGVAEDREEKYRQLRYEEGNLERSKQEYMRYMKELDEFQEVLQLEGHKKYLQGAQQLPGKQYHQSFQDQVLYVKKQIQDSLQALRQQEAAETEYSRKEEEWQNACVQTDQEAVQLERSRRLEDDERDRLIEAFYIYEKTSTLLGLDHYILQRITGFIQHYQGMADEKKLQEAMMQHVELLRKPMKEEFTRLKYSLSLCQTEHQAAIGELEALLAMKEPVPMRSAKTMAAREALTHAGVPFHSFYEVIDFADEVSKKQAALIEEQLADAGILDALVVTPEWMERALQVLGRQSDQIICCSFEHNTRAEFPLLKPSGITPEFDHAARAILRMIALEDTGCGHLTLAIDGMYSHGIIRGHSLASDEYGYIGLQAREQKRLAMIEKQRQIVLQKEQHVNDIKQQISDLEEQLAVLATEYNGLPSTKDLIQALDIVKECEHTYRQYKDISERLEKEKNRLFEVLHQKRQGVLTSTKGLPYPRKVNHYEEALEAAGEYERCVSALERKEEELGHAKIIVNIKKEQIDQLEWDVEQTHLRITKISRRLELKELELAAIEEILSKPENKELAQKLVSIENRLGELTALIESLNAEIAGMAAYIKLKSEELVLQQAQQEEVTAALQAACHCYEEELHLGYVIAAENRSADDVLKEAIGCIRDGDRMRGSEEMYNALHRNYTQHLSYLSAYQPKIEECFDYIPGFTSKRYNIRFTWNGQQLSLYEFHKLMRSTIEETQLLIQEEDRKLFEDILADTLVQKLNYRIMESRRWIRNMSGLMGDMDTSMGLNFALDWRGRIRSDDQELDTAELEKLFSRDRALLTNEDREKVSRHFRLRIQQAKQIVEENGQTVNYADLVRDALDYRQWFEFRMFYKRKGKDKKELTNAAFNQFSGGEKAMAMYVPLFAAVSAQYQMAEDTSPFIIALDEAFAGVDEKNISTMFELVETLQFGYIMNSQALWGCYETVKSLSICELLPSEERDMITVIPYHWNGKKRSVFE